MIDFLLASGQVFSIASLLYGAYLAVTFKAQESSPAAECRYDALTTHAWPRPAYAVDARYQRLMRI
jgi:hypothetical protein